MSKSKFTVDEIVDFLRKEEENETIEGNLIRSKLIRELYKQLGTPEEKDFPNVCEIAGRYWKKMRGYTTDIEFVRDKGYMRQYNNTPTNWRISHASGTKLRIVENYTRAGWYCTVQAYNVICTKYVQHPRYKNILVKFYSSRDCNKYEYVIVREEDDE